MSSSEAPVSPCGGIPAGASQARRLPQVSAAAAPAARPRAVPRPRPGSQYGSGTREALGLEKSGRHSPTSISPPFSKDWGSECPANAPGHPETRRVDTRPHPTLAAFPAPRSSGFRVPQPSGVSARHTYRRR